MWYLAVVLLLTLMLTLPAVAGSGDRTIRDRNGTIIGTWTNRGQGNAEFRDRNGTLKATRTRRGDNVTYRDRNGTIIGTDREEGGD